MTNPWTAIWTRPRQAVRAAVEQDRTGEMYLLGGLITGFDNVSDSGLGDRASFREVQHAYAWSFVPLLPALAMTLVLVAVYGRGMFSSEGPDVEGAVIDVVLLIGFLALVLGVWALVSFFRALSEVQGFSVWKALASAAIPMAALIAVVVAVWLVVR